MIYGVGVDLLRSERMQAAWLRFGERLARKLLMPEELERFARARRPARSLAMAFAAKEATVKALGTGFRGVGYRDCGVVHAASGQPQLVFSPALRARLDALGVAGGHVSLTDEGGMICAMVVLERLSAAADR
ncbi:MAG: holo-ACP synthase [Gammaproteobacteria bacterium]|jgi:holo-[acyl-carrier protein] synthase